MSQEGKRSPHDIGIDLLLTASTVMTCMPIVSSLARNMATSRTAPVVPRVFPFRDPFYAPEALSLLK
jgi:hypothetical protein